MIEKVAELLNWYSQANPYIDWDVQGNEEIKNYRRAQATEFLSLISEEIKKVEYDKEDIDPDHMTFDDGFDWSKVCILTLFNSK